MKKKEVYEIILDKLLEAQRELAYAQLTTIGKFRSERIIELQKEKDEMKNILDAFVLSYL